jgi:LmbE family N-acetylglucosaminyl deacetylase
MTASHTGQAAGNLIDGPGTSELTWRRWPGWRHLPVRDPAVWSSAVILAAHPDDEVLGAGGVISLLAGAGSRLRLVAVTDGEASHAGGGDPAALARRRSQERAEALTILGAGDVEVMRLGLPDSGLAGQEDRLAAALTGLVAGFEVCLAPWPGDVHADHEAVGRAAGRSASRLFFYPVWMWHWSAPADPRVPWERAVRVPLPPALALRKQAAIGCFGSQLEPRPNGAKPVLPDDFVSHFTRDFEVLFPGVPARDP